MHIYLTVSAQNKDSHVYACKNDTLEETTPVLFILRVLLPGTLVNRKGKCFLLKVMITACFLWAAEK